MKKPHAAVSRWALWVFAAALLLKAAMPLLASASARAQGKQLVEVCTVYGMATMPVGGAEAAPLADDGSHLHDHHPDHHGGAPEHDAPSPHGSEHCALTALGAIAAPALPTVLAAAPTAPGERALPRSYGSAARSDRCASWVARLQHGPPSLV